MLIFSDSQEVSSINIAPIETGWERDKMISYSLNDWFNVILSDFAYSENSRKHESTCDEEHKHSSSIWSHDNFSFWALLEL